MRRWILAAALVALATCTDYPGGMMAPPEPLPGEVAAEEPGTVVSTVLVLPWAAEIEVGDSLQLMAYVLDRRGYFVDTGVVWSSSDTTVATVDSLGMVRTLTPYDTATVYATVPDSAGTAGEAAITVPGANRAPVLIQRPRPLWSPVGDTAWMTLGAYFRDDDDDPLAAGVTGADSALVLWTRADTVFWTAAAALADTLIFTAIDPDSAFASASVPVTVGPGPLVFRETFTSADDSTTQQWKVVRGTEARVDSGHVVFRWTMDDGGTGGVRWFPRPYNRVADWRVEVTVPEGTGAEEGSAVVINIVDEAGNWRYAEVRFSPIDDDCTGRILFGWKAKNGTSWRTCLPLDGKPKRVIITPEAVYLGGSVLAPPVIRGYGAAWFDQRDDTPPARLGRIATVELLTWNTEEDVRVDEVLIEGVYRWWSR